MDYIEAFKNLKTNNKYSRKSPHKAILLLTVIEMYETNALSENIIYYDDKLKDTFQKVWDRVLKNETLFHAEAYFPFWFMQSEDFWHIVPKRGKEEIITLMIDEHIKPSESKLVDCVKYAELDEDLFFLMTLPSGRSSLKKALLETYTDLTEKQINLLSQSDYNVIDRSASALSEYESMLSKNKDTGKSIIVQADRELTEKFNSLDEDLQIVLNIEYYSFLKKHRIEREMFKEICPTVYDLYDHIVYNPLKQGDLSPSFAVIYINFLSDLKISLLSEDGSMDLIDKIVEAINIISGNTIESVTEELSSVTGQPTAKDTEKNNNNNNFVDSTIKDVTDIDALINNRKGQAWTKEEEQTITQYYQQGKDTLTIAALVGRTDVAIKMRLGKLGLIDYSYNDFKASKGETKDEVIATEENDFTIENSIVRCSILNKYGDRVFSDEGKFKYIKGKLYRIKLTENCFTIKGMFFNGHIWTKGSKLIVAYPASELFRIVDRNPNYCDLIEDIVDSPIFKECKLKVMGNWFFFNGNRITDAPSPQIVDDKRPIRSIEAQIKKDPLYEDRKQALLRAMTYFRIPASIKDICRTISRTAWGDVIKEKDVEEIINTITEVDCVDGKYILHTRRY